MTFLEEYGTKVLDGKIVACHRIKQVYEMLLNKLYKKTGPWIFDEELANRPIDFIETFCKQAQGQLGSPLSLKLFQKAKFQAIFGFVHQDILLRQYNEVLTIEGRKNGKTTEMAAVETYLLVGDSEGSPEIYNIATKLDQAKKGFDEAHKMIK
ncbi:terminase large subunit domain-containing protein [Clostridium magnum]|uniref:Phage terminase n=1 Tax=Clostridium magnum DSM 2767 TaxID=1121326 RepID=A0A161Y687_9CLOT|nr:terminase large subunit [Clostridium magnum]KZL93809.1 phage terminase [Clostridium magnum DSM 2767]SHI08521.1 Phage Terminase [Clostridium magnum DSM 2767]